MQEQPSIQSPEQQKKPLPSKVIPKGCSQLSNQKIYKDIVKFIMISDMFNIVSPFRYNLMGFVIVRRKDPQEGSILELFHEVSKRLILKAVSKSGQIGAKFVVMCGQTGKVIARVRGDLMGNKYFIYDDGNNPSRKKFPSRKQLGYVYLQNNDFFSNKPPGLSVILPTHTKRIQEDTEIQKVGPLYQSQGILQLDQNISQLLKSQTSPPSPSKRSYTISSVQPAFCPIRKGYVMDLKGLISEPSQVNMVMKTSANQECLVMGKRGQNSFYLYYGRPLTLIQSFGIFLAKYDSRKE